MVEILREKGVFSKSFLILDLYNCSSLFIRLDHLMYFKIVFNGPA
jgi:hypothetical protein